MRPTPPSWPTRPPPSGFCLHLQGHPSASAKSSAGTAPTSPRVPPNGTSRGRALIRGESAVWTGDRGTTFACSVAGQGGDGELARGAATELCKDAGLLGRPVGLFPSPA